MNAHEAQPDMTLFLASSVHDMKNSISLLSGMLEKLLHELKPEQFPAYQDMTQMLYEVTRVNCNLIQLLTLYKVGQQHYPFDSQEHSVADFIRDTVAQSQALLRSRNIALSVDCPDELYWYFDEYLIGGVINHALNNAAKYTRSQIHLAVVSAERQLEIRVEDDGEGYPTAMLAAGDAPMQGVDFSTGSTGLGLYFSKVVAEMHQNRGQSGAVRLENGGRFGGGCLVLSLP